MRQKIIVGCFLGLMLLGGSSFSPAPDDNSFRTVRIGSQEWMVDNLNVSHFRNGDPIFEANDYESWEYANIKGIPAWCYYNNNPDYGKRYGKLYNAWVVMDKRGIGPEGWHIPKETEWATLGENLGKATWNCAGKDTAFPAAPGGYRTHEAPKYYGGPFYEAGTRGYWWSSSRYVVDNFWASSLTCDEGGLDMVSFDRTAALSIRLVRDIDGQ